MHDLNPRGGAARRGRIDAIGDLTAFDLSPFAGGQDFGRSGDVERGFTSGDDF